MQEYVIIIPTLNPSEELTGLVQELQSVGFDKIIVWDDGSGQEYENIFQQVKSLGCEVGHHEKNIGKGGAIKSAMEYAHQHFGSEKGYITVDGDGQHLPVDVKRIAEKMKENPQSLVLGVRNFKQKGIPFRSVLGNRLTSFVFRMSSGFSCPDTQTGLRGIPVAMRGFALNIEGNRYEYEMNFLAEAVGKYTIRMVTIETVYEDGNQSSHFRPVRDSILIYQRFLKYTISSLSGAFVDYVAFLIFFMILPFEKVQNVCVASVLARILSGMVNYTLNRLWSFQSTYAVKEEVMRYGILFLGQMCVSAVSVALLSILLFPLLAKIMVDTTLFFVSYIIQKKWVFCKRS